MKQLLKKSRLIWATALVAQAVTLFVLFVWQTVKNKSVAKTLLATSLIEGVLGGAIFAKLFDEAKEAEQRLAEEELAETAYYSIPLDETASESEFG